MNELRETKATCCYCGVGCGVIVQSDGDELVDDPVFRHDADADDAGPRQWAGSGAYQAQQRSRIALRKACRAS